MFKRGSLMKEKERQAARLAVRQQAADREQDHERSAERAGCQEPEGKR